MREEQFYIFLVNDVNIESKVKAVRSRVSRARTVEKNLQINLDSVVKDDFVMYETLLRITNELNDDGKLQNAVRKYYLFINSKEFPSKRVFENKYKLSVISQLI